MGGDGGVQGMGGVNNGFQLLVRELDVLRGVVWGKEAAGGHDLNKVSADLYLMAHGTAEKVYPAAHGGVLPLHKVGQGGVDRQFLGGVPVTAGSAEEVGSRHHAGTLDKSCVNGPLYI